MGNLCHHLFLGEIDEEVSAVWSVLFHAPIEDVAWLTSRIMSFSVSRENVLDVLSSESLTLRERAFRTILKNRVNRGGIMAPGAGLVKDGEKGRGLRSRWYPATLAERIKQLCNLRERVTFQQKNAFDLIDAFSGRSDVCWFVDPPYTAGGKRAGARLYEHSDIDHEALFERMSQIRGRALLTYDDAPEVRDLAMRYGFRVRSVPMKTNHHQVKNELLLTRGT